MLYCFFRSGYIFPLGFQNFVRGIWQKDTQILADEIAVAEKFEDININVNQSVDNAIVDVQNEEK